ncbi:MAG: tetratricopeptide repeat protein [Gemmatimonadetes bacterium]|nr:tetratricopeptide repeat protein [Gemmatimonadota bacterium]
MIPALLLALQTATAAVPATAAVRAPSKCDHYADSVVAAVMDSVPDRALGFARRLSRECRNDFEPLFRAGRAINSAARFSVVEGNSVLRELAGRLLGRAAVLRPRNAAAWLEYGTLLRKMGGVQRDAQRAIERAVDLADQYPDSAPPDLIARMMFQRARYEQDGVDRLRFLKEAYTLGVSTPSCAAIGAFCDNYANPQQFNDQLKDAPAIDPDFTGRRERMIEFYRRAVELDPTLLEAAERYGRELAFGGEWEQLRGLAQRTKLVAGAAGAFTAVEALALAKLGRLRDADSLFRRAIPELPDSMRRWYERPPPGLDTIPDFWTRVRPLWVTDFNEVLLEHRTRVTYAFLVLRDREAEVAGPETPMGDALLRYGWPTMITQVRRNASAVLSAIQSSEALSWLEGGADPSANVGTTKDESGGRWLFWTYAMDRPSMIFETRPGIVVARYMRDAPAEEYAAALRQSSPLVFRSQLAPKAFRLPVQVARFKGAVPEQTIVAIYGIVPAKQMALPPADSVTVGLFVFRDTAGFEPVVRQRAQYLPGEALTLGYQLPLGVGRYAVSLEALAPAFGGSATARDSVRTQVWKPDSLTVSDLVIAHRVESRVEGQPTSWRDLSIDASRTLEVPKGASLWVVWESYGLRIGSQGTGRYQVNLALRDANAQAAPLRLLERLGVARRQGVPAVALEWTSERRLAADGRALEYVAVQLPEDAEGRYELVVTVTDPVTGRSAKTSRTIAIAPVN